jgi:dipeptidyl aminopeptidase/acylaminoacyl peptidase
LAVCEDHTGEGEPINRLVSLPLDGGEPPTVLFEGHDFYAAPRLSPTGDAMCFLAWDHPELPFLATRLYQASLDEGGSPHAVTLVAGTKRASITQPSYSPGGRLTFMSDRNGYYNLHQLRDGEVVDLAPIEADLAHPPWALGNRDFLFLDEHRLVVLRADNGLWRLALLDLEGPSYTTVDTPFSAIAHVARAQGGLLAIAGGPRQVASVVRIALDGGSPPETLRESYRFDVDATLLSEPEPIAFCTEGDATAHAFFYPPHNPDFAAPKDELPPLIVRAHGGPTSSTAAILDPRIQYWTSRGFGVVDVNYRGSTGFGRDYRDALEHRWGIVDVDDCVAAARHLVDAGRVDGRRLLITGGSAGGYTTLAALAFRDLFRAGASHYGVSDLEALMADTHKFESRYDVYLLGPDETGKRASKRVMRERSPIHSADRIACPVIFIQGLEDRVVPPSQAEKMVTALEDKGIPVAYVAFEGEQHGFRRAESIARALEAELYFYAAILDLSLPEAIAPVEIRGLAGASTADARGRHRP